MLEVMISDTVSRSSSMVRGVAGPGISQESPICLRQGPLSEGIEEEADDKDRSATFSSPPSRVDAATSTSTQAQQRAMSNPDDSTTLAPPRASCGCTRHYKYPILSTIVPTSLEKCFEALFSARGAGQGDHLVNETLRSVNGSKSIKITPWTKGQADEGDNNNVWEGKTRTLEHSSILKAQHSHNARTDCRETQRVLEYNLRTIRILSDVWPNLSGGHLISLLSQICLTWDSPGYTRIKCFTEVEYTRAPLWVSAYEADLLEPIDRFYKELIRRLVESIDKRDAPHSWTATTLTISNSPSATGPGNQQGSPSGKASTSFKPSSYSTRTSQPQDAEDASPALSLLSQQLRKNPPAQFRQSRASMESVRPSPESVAQTHATPPSAAPIARRNKAAALIVQAMFPVTISPTKNLSIISEQPTERTVFRDSVAKTGATTATLWLGLLKKGMAVFKIVTDRTATTPFAGQVITSGSKAVSRDHASKLTTILDVGSTECSDKPRSEIEDEQAANPRLSSTIASCCSRDQISKSLDELPSGKRNSGPTPSYTILRVVSVIFAMGMVISAMNVWHLHSAVSSVVDVLQLSHGSISLSDADYAFQDQRHDYYEALAPIRMQKELLRAEITELMLMLDSARRSPKPDHDATSI
ncbi:hypothetical protein BGZ72_004592 [Mortierella alpina]|nr:hypothetical protein BGZ72_004592 [Mortierella alpina]